jgi:uncharacterized membrane protein required for colicin V production
MMYWALFFVAFFPTLAMMIQPGFWSNAITLINIIISGVVAFAFYSPLAIYLDEMLDGEYTYLLDFVCIWLLFIVTMVICRVITGVASKTRMRFKHPIDPVGGPVVALIGAWVMASMVMATLHTAPMPADAFSGKLLHDDVASASSLSSPDIGWLRFMQTVTQADSFGRAGGGFSAEGFVKIYEAHRTAFGKAAPKWIVVRRS